MREVYLSDNDMPFLRVSSSLTISGARYQNKAIFLELVVKTCQTGKLCLDRVVIWSNFCVSEYMFDRFFVESTII